LIQKESCPRSRAERIYISVRLASRELLRLIEGMTLDDATGPGIAMVTLMSGFPVKKAHCSTLP
jgi:hypothetical protein